MSTPPSPLHYKTLSLSAWCGVVQMTVEDLRDFAAEQGVSTMSHDAKSLRSAVVKELETRGPWAEIAPGVKRAVKTFITAKDATPAS